MRVSGKLFLLNYKCLLIISSFLLVYGSVHAEDKESETNTGQASSYIYKKCRENCQDFCQVAQCPEIKELIDKQNMLQQMVIFMVLIIVGIFSTGIWSMVSWFVRIKTMFGLCFFISLVWNGMYLYQTAVAEHMAKMVQMEKLRDKCTGEQNGWLDAFYEWYRTTWTLQEDPCKEYYEVMLVNPILRVTPTKVFSMTITMLFTDPLKHFGQGFNEFLRALLKDLPFILQIPVLFILPLSILVFMFIICQEAVRHIVLRLLQGGRQDPPPSIAQQHAASPLQEREEHGKEKWSLFERGKF